MKIGVCGFCEDRLSLAKRFLRRRGYDVQASLGVIPEGSEYLIGLMDADTIEDQARFRAWQDDRLDAAIHSQDDIASSLETVLALLGQTGDTQIVV